MRSLTAPPKAKNDDERILPLINVVFLLLIFFMVAGALSKPDPFELSAPTSRSDGVAGDHDLVIHMGTEGRLALDGRMMAEDALIEAVADRFATEETVRVRVKADGGMQAAQAIRLMQRLRGVGVKQVKLLTVREGG